MSGYRPLRYTEDGLLRTFQRMQQDIEQLKRYRAPVVNIPELDEDEVRSAGTRPALLIASATGDSIASGGDYLTFGATVYDYNFGPASGQSVTWPHTAVGEIQIELAWQGGYDGGGTVEIEVDGAVPAWGTLGSGTSGSTGWKRRSVHIAGGSQVKIKITQGSGSAQLVDAFVEFTIPDPAAGTGEEVLLVDFQQAGWRYLEVAHDNNTDYSSPGYDDSGWSTGTATFGSATGVAGDRPFTTSLTMDGRVWLRRTITANLSAATVTVMADNTGEAWWNGTYLGSFSNPGDPSPDTADFSVPGSALSGYTSHVLAIRVTDDAASGTGDNFYADGKVVGVRL